jgi:hypothetical protein
MIDRLTCSKYSCEIRDAQTLLISVGLSGFDTSLHLINIRLMMLRTSADGIDDDSLGYESLTLSCELLSDCTSNKETNYLNLSCKHVTVIVKAVKVATHLFSSKCVQ